MRDVVLSRASSSGCLGRSRVWPARCAASLAAEGSARFPPDLGLSGFWTLDSRLRTRFG